MPPRLHRALGAQLPRVLRAPYLGERATVGEFAASLAPDDARRALRAALYQMFEQSYGLDIGRADALAALVVGSSGDLAALVDRVALIRTLIVAGLGPEIASYFDAAARGAVEGFAADIAAITAGIAPESEADLIAGSSGRPTPVLPAVDAPSPAPRAARPRRQARTGRDGGSDGNYFPAFKD